MKICYFKDHCSSFWFYTIFSQMNNCIQRNAMYPDCRPLINFQWINNYVWKILCTVFKQKVNVLQCYKFFSFSSFNFILFYHVSEAKRTVFTNWDNSCVMCLTYNVLFGVTSLNPLCYYFYWRLYLRMPILISKRQQQCSSISI